MLPPLGILFALLVGFIAVEVWSNFDKAKVAVASEASALRAVVLLAGTFPEEQKTRIHALIDRHIEEAINKFPRLIIVSTTISGDGVTLKVHFSRKEGAPVRYIGGDDPTEAAAVREVDLRKKFHMRASDLARASS
jgi:hypothetical protein